MARPAEAEGVRRGTKHAGRVCSVARGRSRSPGKAEPIASKVATVSVYRRIVDTMREAAFTTTFDGRILFCNARLGELVGRPPEQVVGRSLMELVDAQDAAAAEALLIEGRRQPTQRRLAFRAAGGTTVPAHVSGTVVRHPGQDTLCLVATNLTELERSIERNRAEQQLFEANQRLRALMNALPVGVSFSNDRSCREITGNPAVLAQFDAGPGDNLSASAPDESARGRQVRYFRDGRPIIDAELPLQRSVAENRAIPPMELEVVMPSGRRWYADASGAPVRDARGEAVGGVAVTVDITGRKEVEEALRRANARLEHEIREGTEELAQRATQLRALAAELTLSEQRERRRMAKVLHDHLQQLLAGAKFRTAILARRPDPRVKQAAHQIEELLESALDASRALTVELSPPILHDGTLADGLVWLARWMSDRHGLVVVLSEMPVFPALAEHVKLLLFESVRELLFNAVKHAHVRSVTVNLRWPREDELQIIVTDSGRGFDPAALKRPGEAGGGFGLFSIQERLDLIGGRMEVHSARGRGSRITLTVALAREPLAERPIAVAMAQQAAVRRADGVPARRLLAPVRVLLADDHAVMREGLRQLLEMEPDIRIVGEAVDGEAAVEMARRLRPDVILMDIDMPKLDGVGATRLIHGDHPEIRVIGLSMFEEKERAQAMSAAGAVRYLSKSGRSADLIAAIVGGAGPPAGGAPAGDDAGLAAAVPDPRARS